MSVQLVHVEHHPSNTVVPRITLQALSLWLDKHIRADASLDAATRGEPATANLLHNILIDEGPTQADREAARRFAALVERFADTEDTQIATVARDVARGFRKLADEHDELSLQLV